MSTTYAFLGRFFSSLTTWKSSSRITPSGSSRTTRLNVLPCSVLPIVELLGQSIDALPVFFTLDCPDVTTVVVFPGPEGTSRRLPPKDGCCPLPFIFGISDACICGRSIPLVPNPRNRWTRGTFDVISDKPVTALHGQSNHWARLN
jgi:hypothetical protein